MKIRKRLWSLHCGNKAVVFALDALIAVVMVFALLAVATSFLIKGETDVSSNIQLSRTGSDIVALLDNTKVLDSLDGAEIETALNNLIPDNYGMNLDISWQDTEDLSTGSIITGDSTPDDRFVATGKRFFLSTDDNEEAVLYCGVVRYSIWLR